MLSALKEAQCEICIIMLSLMLGLDGDRSAVVRDGLRSGYWPRCPQDALEAEKPPCICFAPRLMDYFSIPITSMP